MKKSFLLSMVALVLFSCHKDDAAADASFKMKAPGADYAAACMLPIQPVAGDIGVNAVWTNDRVWEIEGVVRVKNGAKLTIQPGTFIIAKQLGVGVATGILVITRTGRIDAQGTVDAPIIFTSRNLIDCNLQTMPEPGDFGGIVLLGNAPVNTGLTTNIMEGLGDQPNALDFQYGGGDDFHNAGILKYVRIEYAGRILNALTGIEVNSLSCGGIGTDTTIDYVQASYGLDDSFEFFGGTVNASHLVSFACQDDNFDFDLGYKGSVVTAVAIADKYSLHSTNAGIADSNGIEIDNNPMGTITTFITKPLIKDMSIVGLQCPDYTMLENGIHVRRNGKIDMLGGITVTGYNYGIYWQSPSAPIPPYTGLSIHGVTDDVLPAGTSLGFGNTIATGCNAPLWGSSPYQPFYNNISIPFSLSGGTTGAFSTSSAWINNWTKFSNF